MLEARTKRATLISNLLAVMAWIDFGSKRSIKLPVVSITLRIEILQVCHIRRNWSQGILLSQR